jgi:cytochrome c oxidase subunit 2
MSNIATRLQTCLLSFLVLAHSGQSMAERSSVNMTESVTSVGRDIFGLHMEIFLWCVGIGVVVFSVMLYSMIAHRKSRGAVAANFHDNMLLEVVWTVIPFIILGLMAWPATKTLIKIYDSDESEVDVVITGYQWYWKYEYLDQDVSFFSYLSTPQEQIDNLVEQGENYLLEVDEPLVIPANKKVRFLITSNDVIHSWWVPDLAVKKDAIPGYVNETWALAEKPGTYRGVCAELCGEKHGFMPIVVEALPEDEYLAWLEQRRKAQAELKAMSEKIFTLAELNAKGQQIYESRYAACHGLQGEGGVGKPIKGSKIAMGPIADHIDIIVNGSANNPMMAAYKDQLSEVEMAAVITYQRNAFGNDTGDIVQPVDILKFKQGK